MLWVSGHYNFFIFQWGGGVWSDSDIHQKSIPTLKGLNDNTADHVLVIAMQSVNNTIDILK